MESSYDYDDSSDDAKIFSPDRKRAAAWYVSRHKADLFDDDTTYEIKVWNVATHNQVACFHRYYDRGHAGEDGSPVYNIAFSPDGEKLLITTGAGVEEERLPRWSADEDGAGVARNKLCLLSLRGNRIGPELCEKLAQSPPLGRVSELDLAGNAVGDSGARALAASSHLARLVALDLSANRVGPDGARALAASPHLGRLKRLELTDNPIGGAGAAALQERFGESLRVREERVGEGRTAGWSEAQLRRAFEAVSAQLSRQKYVTAVEASTAGGGPALVVHAPGARLQPRDDATSFLVRAALSNARVEGLYLEHVPALGAVARLTLARLLEELAR
jgi:hypothetical protein